ncbi:hypothetical protein [Modestobacter marinus]|uniref:hypothetical protein n=1 Tax=Modestobacter marinus TaxID=477641 RepID=UPI001C975F87|nr:hypothetical protein [Modestobacter marinus]
MSTVPEVAITPEVLEGEFSLVTAVTRLDFLSRRDNVVIDKPVDSVEDDDWMSLRSMGTSLDAEEALELLALGEVVARKAHGGRNLGIWAALRGGCDWSRIAAALDTTPAQAWDEYAAWLDAQVEARAAGYPDALDAATVTVARERAGRRPE